MRAIQISATSGGDGTLNIKCLGNATGHWEERKCRYCSIVASNFDGIFRSLRNDFDLRTGLLTILGMKPFMPS